MEADSASSCDSEESFRARRVDGQALRPPGVVFDSFDQLPHEDDEDDSGTLSLRSWAPSRWSGEICVPFSKWDDRHPEAGDSKRDLTSDSMSTQNPDSFLIRRSWKKPFGNRSHCVVALAQDEGASRSKWDDQDADDDFCCIMRGDSTDNMRRHATKKLSGNRTQRLVTWLKDEGDLLSKWDDRHPLADDFCGIMPSNSMSTQHRTNKMGHPLKKSGNRNHRFVAWAEE